MAMHDCIPSLNSAVHVPNGTGAELETEPEADGAASEAAEATVHEAADALAKVEAMHKSCSHEPFRVVFLGVPSHPR